MRNVFKLSLFAVVFGASSSFVGAQAPKSKPLATPPPSSNTAEVISRDGDTVELTPVERKQIDRPVEKAVSAPGVAEMMERIKKLEAGQQSSYDEKQKRLLLNLDILTRAEQRSESLRKQLFEMIEKENAVKSRLDQIEFDSRPEIIERNLQLAGSLRPEDIRDAKRRSLRAEKSNLDSLLAEIQSTRANLNVTLLRAEQMVEKLRAKLEKDIDDSFLKDQPDFRDPLN